MDYNCVLARIAYYQKLHKYSFPELAVMVGLTQSTFRKRMQKPEMFTLAELARLADGFGISVTDFFKTG